MARVTAALLVGFVLIGLSIITATVSVMAYSPTRPIAQVTTPRAPTLKMLNQAGESITTLTDGAFVRFSVTSVQAAAEPISYSLHLDRATNRLGSCEIPAGQYTCISEAISSLGWYWEDNEIQPTHTIHAANSALARWLPVASLDVSLNPRPVVMVHGFGSDFTTWLSYLGPSGFLARAGIPGYAVGDGQVAGTMQTGSLLNPTMRTNTIARNAEILSEYIANVKSLTGAGQVDLVVHSMGGLISRYYIDRVMGNRDVAQLIMLGTPNGGSNCAVMIGALGLYQPAGLELREDYVANVFNPQITEQHEIPFYNFAGTPIQQALFSPCSKVPNDLVVSLDSASSAPVELVEVPILHTDLTLSQPLFNDHVLPLLRQSLADFAKQGAPSPPTLTADDEPLQYSQVFTGFASTPEGVTHVINIDNNVAVANFALYDPSRSLTLTVRGASGNVLVLSPDTNGMITVDDPESLLYLGYGFNNPNPGPWQVTVHTTELSPPLGSEYAIVAQYAGGSSIEATLSNHLPGLGEAVEVVATINIGDEPLPVDAAQVTLVLPDGTSQTLPVTAEADGIVASWPIEEVGVYGIDISMRALLPDGTVAERSSFLALEAFEIAPQALP